MIIELMTTDLPATIHDAQELGLKFSDVKEEEWTNLRLEGTRDQLTEALARHSYKPRRGPIGARSRRLANRDIHEAIQYGGEGAGFLIVVQS